MIQTVIGINSSLTGMSGGRKKRMKDYKNELRVIISQIDTAKNRLAELTEEMDAEDRDVSSLDEALDALEDAIDIMEDAMEDEEE